MKSYKTKTGALISEKDYRFLSSSQQEQCEEYKVEHVEEKKDFTLYNQAIDDVLEIIKLMDISSGEILESYLIEEIEKLKKK